MDWRTFPPLSSLRAFLAFVQTETLDQAGARIGVTHAAVSQQIRTLEQHLGLKLVDRATRRLTLTDEGRRLASSLEAGFGQIAETLRALTEVEAARPIRITAAPAFASDWLLPRLPDFRARHPGIDLSIDSSATLRVVGVDSDVGLRFGQGRWPGVDSRLILRSPLVVVAAPALVGEGAERPLAELARLPWLQEFGTREVADFCERNGLAPDIVKGITSVPGDIMLAAARNAQGLALIARAFVEGDIAAGRLRVMFRDSQREGYYLVVSPGPQRPAVEDFCTWILRQAGPT